MRMPLLLRLDSSWRIRSLLRAMLARSVAMRSSASRPLVPVICCSLRDRICTDVSPSEMALRLSWISAMASIVCE